MIEITTTEGQVIIKKNGNQIIGAQKGSIYYRPYKEKVVLYQDNKYKVIEEAVYGSITVDGIVVTKDNANQVLDNIFFLVSGGGDYEIPTFQQVLEKGNTATISPEIPFALLDQQAIPYGQVKQLIASISPKVAKGDISSSGLNIRIEIENSIVELAYKSSTQSALKIYAKTGTLSGNGWIQETSATGIITVVGSTNGTVGTGGVEIADMTTASNNSRLLVYVFSTVGTAYEITAFTFNNGVSSTLVVKKLS